MARFKQTFRVDAPLSAVWQLHDDPRALIDLTPPPIRVKILKIDRPLHQGSALTFRLYLIEPLGATWQAIYDEFNPYQPGLTVCNFVDRSLSSPFKFWVHRHTFRDLGDGTSTVTDDATFRLADGLLGALITAIAWPTIAFMFLYRRMKTRQLLRSGAYSHVADQSSV